jgi:hypothetical protein
MIKFRQSHTNVPQYHNGYVVNTNVVALETLEVYESWLSAQLTFEFRPACQSYALHCGQVFGFRNFLFYSITIITPVFNNSGVIL